MKDSNLPMMFVGFAFLLAIFAMVALGFVIWWKASRHKAEQAAPSKIEK